MVIQYHCNYLSISLQWFVIRTNSASKQKKIKKNQLQ